MALDHPPRQATIPVCAPLNEGVSQGLLLGGVEKELEPHLGGIGSKARSLSLLNADRDGREVEGAFAAGNGLAVLVPPASKGKECKCSQTKLDDAKRL